MRKYSIAIVCIGALLLLYGTANATIWYVHPDSALNLIQAGIDSCSTGDTVLVAPGTYIENINFNGMAITVTSEYGPDTTIIDGSSPANPDSGSVVTFVSGEDTTSVLERFTLTNGTGTWDPDWEYLGGGIFCSNSSPTITNNIIQMCSTDWGGGITCEYNSNPIISSNTITGNTAVNAGSGIDCAFTASPRILGNTITGNSADWAGGINCDSLSQPIIIGNTISGNYATIHGGGIGCFNNASPTITGNTIIGDTAGVSGGGIYSNYSMPTIDSNFISNNTAADGGGGGILCRYSSANITGNTITGNSADFGGGIGCYRYSAAMIISNIITGNTADLSGGGIDCWMNSGAEIKHNTITSNVSALGAGISCLRYSSPIIDSCSISYNDGDGVTCDTASTPEIHNNDICGNTHYGVRNLDSTVIVDAENNWWGDASGPYHATNPGGLGDTVSDYVDFDPWLLDPVFPGIEEHESIQQVTTTLKIFPNPFSKLTKISFGTVRGAKSVELKIYDATGRVVKEFNHLTNKQIFWNGTDDFNRQLPSGIYFLKLQAGDYSATKKLLLIR